MRPLVSRMGADTVAIATSAAPVLDSLREHQVTATVDLTLIGHYYERFADNAVEVGRQTIFLPVRRNRRPLDPTPRAGPGQSEYDGL
ncbi:hypothetical protein OH799_05990 [Nocardia sp. NBC_00881]|uniref:hypothetical protein n=1 Tax=Nocardia sp. NBC_00881 TaxID=2975995 RepID=UPI0038631E46|nr:hypothetical protein OH799_05990 [Nocardia sp. NBC_00881]